MRRRNPLAKVCMYLVSGSKARGKKIGTIILNEGKRLESFALHGLVTPLRQYELLIYA